MEDKVSLKKKYINQIKELKKHNKLYYLKNNPSITDKEYDDIKKNILDLEKKYKFLKHKESPSINIGFKPSKIFEKHKHKVPMLSLSNVFNRDDIINFEKKN